MSRRLSSLLQRLLPQLLPHLLLYLLLVLSTGGPSTAFASGRGEGVSLTALSSARFCDRPETRSAREQDRLLRFAAVVRQALTDSGMQAALISRSGIDLSRLKIRYSHSGIALRDEQDPKSWSVRQLYYACDEGQPRLFDEGVAGFLFNTDQPEIGYVSMVLIPAEPARQLSRSARDDGSALRLLAGTYSANAYPFSDRYQNCNQWVIEMAAFAWGGLPDGEDLRRRAQTWLREAGYAPAPVVLDSHLTKFAASWMPLVHLDDHPDDERYGLESVLSMPTSIEAFVRQRYPDSSRIEICHAQDRIVVRRGWEPIAQGCLPGPEDQLLSLD